MMLPPASSSRAWLRKFLATKIFRPAPFRNWPRHKMAVALFYVLAAIIVAGAIMLYRYLATSWGQGMDLDEAKILFYGRSVLATHKYTVYAAIPDFWETLPSILYALAEKCRLSPRTVSAVAGGLDVVFFGLILKNLYPRQFCLILGGMLALAVASIHAFYSTITGTCNLITVVVLASIYLHQTLKSAPPTKIIWAMGTCHLLGLLTYTPYRLVWGWHFIRAFLKRQRAWMIAAVIALLGLGIIMLLTGQSLALFWARGKDNVLGTWADWPSNIWAAVAYLVWPLDPAYRVVYHDGFRGDYLHYLWSVLATIPFLGFSGGLGLILACGWILGKARGKDLKKVLAYAALWGGAIFLPVAFLGPSSSRLYFIVPCLLLFILRTLFKYAPTWTYCWLVVFIVEHSWVLAQGFRPFLAPTTSATSTSFFLQETYHLVTMPSSTRWPIPPHWKRKKTSNLGKYQTIAPSFNLLPYTAMPIQAQRFIFHEHLRFLRQLLQDWQSPPSHNILFTLRPKAILQHAFPAWPAAVYLPREELWKNQVKEDFLVIMWDEVADPPGINPCEISLAQVAHFKAQIHHQLAKTHYLNQSFAMFNEDYTAATIEIWRKMAWR